MTNDVFIEPTASPEKKDRQGLGCDPRHLLQSRQTEVAPRPTWLDQVSAFTCEAPVQSLAIAFLIGVLLSHRH